jgi:DNA-binding LacI/PurR family transcriptional regulator
VVVDDVAVGRLAAGHLLDLGHRHLATFKAARYNSPITLTRIEGQRQAFIERGLDPDRGLHVLPWLWDVGIDLAAAAAAALDTRPDVTAILAPNDGMGIPLVRALGRSGRQVPRDLSVIGADDCGEWPDAGDTNRWTTVRIPLRDLGRQAARALVQRIRGERVPPQLVVPVELVVRASTGSPRAGRVPRR